MPKSVSSSDIFVPLLLANPFNHSSDSDKLGPHRIVVLVLISIVTSNLYSNTYWQKSNCLIMHVMLLNRREKEKLFGIMLWSKIRAIF